MAYSKDSNVLFLHIPKNAGKSIEVALGIVGREGAEAPRSRSFFNRLAKYLLSRTENNSVREKLFGTYDYSLCAQHLTYLEIKLLGLDSEFCDLKPHIACVVRNPYDRAVSTFMHFNGHFDLSEFKDFWLKSWKTADHNVLAHMRRQVDFVCDSNGEVVADTVLRFERLDEEFGEFARMIGLSEVKLEKLGGSGQRKRYADLYDEEARSIVAKKFAADFNQFGYSFE